MKTLRMLSLALLIAGTGFAQTQTWTNGRTTIHYSITQVPAGYTATVCATTNDRSVGLFRIQYVASLADGSEIQYDGVLLRRDLGSCRYVSITTTYPLLDGLVVTPQRAETAVVAIPLPSNDR